MVDVTDVQQGELADYLARRRELLEEVLRGVLAEACLPSTRLHEAMSHGLLNGGKRLRPILLLACAEALPENVVLSGLPQPLLPFAAALECIHSYSLIHDDLPAMDDDDLRRGRPTCHKQFDEATAILAGDALLTLAFELASQPIVGVAAQESLVMVRYLAQGAGLAGMVGGQMLDMLAEKRQIGLEALQTIHRHKTGALIRIACMAGAHLGGGSKRHVQQLTQYGEAIGLAFQITDDILDETGDTQVLGKATGQDQQSAKATYPRLLGLEESRQKARQQVDKALVSLDGFSANADPLRHLAQYILTRTS